MYAHAYARFLLLHFSFICDLSFIYRINKNKGDTAVKLHRRKGKIAIEKHYFFMQIRSFLFHPGCPSEAL